MATMQCNSCGGVYETLQRDGLLYYHACPPIQRARVERLGVQIDVDLADVGIGDKVIELFDAEHPNKRDENVIQVPTPEGKLVSRAKSEGLGAVKL